MLKILSLKYENIKLLGFFGKKYKLKNNNLKESDLQRVYDYHIDPRNLDIYSDKGFVNIDNGQMRGTHWCPFYVKNNKSLYFDSFGGNPDKLLPNQLPKQILYHKYNLQDINSKLCGSYCLYFFSFIERIIYYDTFLKMYFG